MKEKKRILIVEDDLDWQAEMMEVLAGYEILTAASVGDACHQIKNAPQLIDLMILDLGLSKVTGVNSGLTVLACLQNQMPGVRCIVFSGSELPMGKAARLFKHYKVFAGLQKPDDMVRLAKVVEQALKAADIEEQSPVLPDSAAPIIKGGAPRRLEDNHGLLIGVGDYEHPRFASLPATMRDTQTLVDVLTDPRRGSYPPDHVRAIIGAQATATNIRAALRALAHSVTDQSTVCVYFSGHGGRAYKQGEWRTYLCPREADPSDLSNTAISGTEFSAALSAIPARRLVVILDACHAGGSAALKATHGAPLWKAGLAERYYEALSQGSGRVVMASSKAEQYSHVRPEGDLSLFTHHLREALMGKAAVRGDGLVHVLDVFHYVNEAVQADEPDQTPILKVNDLDMNFPIAAAARGILQMLKTSDTVQRIQEIREQIVRDPLAGAKALSTYLEHHPDLAVKRNEVDLKRGQLESIQRELNLFGPDPAKKAEKNRAIFYLLRICLDLEQSEE